jgi:Mitochondrial carrier protein
MLWSTLQFILPVQQARAEAKSNTTSNTEHLPSASVSASQSVSSQETSTTDTIDDGTGTAGIAASRFTPELPPTAYSNPKLGIDTSTIKNPWFSREVDDDQLLALSTLVRAGPYQYQGKPRSVLLPEIDDTDDPAAATATGTTPKSWTYSIKKLFLQGVVVGAASIHAAATQPLSRLQFLLQAQPDLLRQGRLSQPLGGGIVGSYRLMQMKGEYVTSMWRGARGAAATAALYVTAYSTLLGMGDKACDAIIRNTNEDRKLAANVLLMMTSTMPVIAGQALMHPFHVAHVKLSTDVASYKGIGSGVRQYKTVGYTMYDVYRKAGRSAFFRPVALAIATAGVASTVQRNFLGLSEEALAEGADMKQIYSSATHHLWFGATLTYPMLTLQTRMIHVLGTDAPKQGIFRFAWNAIRKDGFRSLYRGYFVHLAGLFLLGEGAKTLLGAAVGPDIMSEGVDAMHVELDRQRKGPVFESQSVSQDEE